MIARELLVKLGFDIDETKFNRFSKNVESLKSNLSSLKGKVGLNIDTTKFNQFKKQIDEVKTKLPNLNLGLSVDTKKLDHFKTQVREVKAKLPNMNLGLNVDTPKLNQFKKEINSVKSFASNLKSKIKLDFELNNLQGTKAKMQDIREQIDKLMYPKINLNDASRYKKELAALTKAERLEVLALNKAEKEATADQIRLLKSKYSELKAINYKLQETQKKFRKITSDVKAANLSFSRFFTKVSAVGLGTGLLSIRSTIKDAKNFKAGGGKTNNHFSAKQLDDVNKFNVSMKQLKKTVEELRNKFVIGLLPGFKKNIDALNEWFLKNKGFIDQKLSKFVEVLSTAFNILAVAAKSVFNVLNPLVSLIGGWGTVLAGFVGAGILSWFFRLTSSLVSAGRSLMVFGTAIRFLGGLLMANPIAAILAAIAGALVYLSYDFFASGRASEFLTNCLESLKKTAKSVVESLKELWHWIVKVGKGMFNIGEDMFAMKFGGKDKNNDQFSVKKLSLPKENIGNYLFPDVDKPTFKQGKFELPIPSIADYRNFSSSNNNSRNTVNHINNNNQTYSITTPITTVKNEDTVDFARKVQKIVKSEFDWQHEQYLNKIGPT